MGRFYSWTMGEVKEREDHPSGDPGPGRSLTLPGTLAIIRAERRPFRVIESGFIGWPDISLGDRCLGPISRTECNCTEGASQSHHEFHISGLRQPLRPSASPQPCCSHPAATGARAQGASTSRLKSLSSPNPTLTPRFLSLCASSGAEPMRTGGWITSWCWP